jgi:hypothetical protein
MKTEPKVLPDAKVKLFIGDKEIQFNVARLDISYDAKPSYFLGKLEPIDLAETTTYMVPGGGTLVMNMLQDVFDICIQPMLFLSLDCMHCGIELCDALDHWYGHTDDTRQDYCSKCRQLPEIQKLGLPDDGKD